MFRLVAKRTTKTLFCGTKKSTIRVASASLTTTTTTKKDSVKKEVPPPQSGIMDEDEEDMVEMFNEETGEWNGPRGLEPTRYGDWESKGRCWDF